MIGRTIYLLIYVITTFGIIDFLQFLFGFKSRYYRSWFPDESLNPLEADAVKKQNDIWHEEGWGKMGAIAKLMFFILYILGIILQFKIIYYLIGS
jgi:hypothetical protein